MLIKFNVRFATVGDEKLYITGSCALLGKYNPSAALPMTKEEGEEDLWSATIQLDAIKERVLSYKYFVADSKGKIRYEVGAGRHLALNSATNTLITTDSWQMSSEESLFLTDPFSHVFFGSNLAPYTQIHRKNHELLVKAVIPNIPDHCNIVMVGDDKELIQGKQMARIRGLKWIAAFDIGTIAGKTWNFRFAKIDSKSGEIEYEEGAPHTLHLPKVGKHDTQIVEYSTVKFRRESPRFAGCAVPLFALRTKKSAGIGEIEDLKLLIDWAHKTGIKVINLLPINDTLHDGTGRDSSPYNNISAFALNPLYISLAPLGKTDDLNYEKEAEEERRSLNRRASVDYEDVSAFKLKYLRHLYAQKREDTTSQPDYYKFVKKNKNWLFPYALFCALRDKYKTTDFNKWEKWSTYPEQLVEDLSKGLNSGVLAEKDFSLLYEEVSFYIYLQYILHFQMAGVLNYAHSCGISLGVEFPMNITPDSVAVWKFPEYFNFKKEGSLTIEAVKESKRTGSLTCGAYRWEAMEKENFFLWKNRIRAISEYFDLFTIGEINEDEKNAPYVIRLLTEMVASSNMLPCGKYSATTSKTPGPIQKKMEELRILSCEHLENEEPPYCGIFTTSTPCGKTLRMWLGEKLQKGAIKSEEEEEPLCDASASECESVITEALATPCMLTILSIQDWMSLDPRLRNRFPESERVSNPEVKGWVWRYRMHINIEQLLEAAPLNAKIAVLIKLSRRE